MPAKHRIRIESKRPTPESPIMHWWTCSCGSAGKRWSTDPGAASAGGKRHVSAQRNAKAFEDAKREASEERDAMPAECRRCSECIGQDHHWLEATVFEPDDPEFECKHCRAQCRGVDDPSGFLVPDDKPIEETEN